MRKGIRFFVLILAIAAAAVFLSQIGRDSLPGDVVRLHILANSDETIDQAAKLKVRDAVLGALSERMKGMKNAEQAEEYLSQNTEEIVLLAEKTLADFGRSYGASASVGNSVFPKREYAGAVYPAGEYAALKIVLGEGKGQNWWCVAFPPLCFNDWTEVEQADAQALLQSHSGEGVRFRSAILEWLGRIMKGVERR